MKIEIDSDERGFQLIVGDEVFDIEDPEALYDQVKARIGPWLRERDEARMEITISDDVSEPVTNLYARLREREAFLCDPDESGGYDVSDPKHPDYHSIHADIWDARDGK